MRLCGFLYRSGQDGRCQSLDFSRRHYESFGWSVRLSLGLGVGVSVWATLTPVKAFYLLAVPQIGVTLDSFCTQPRKILRPAQRKNIPCLENSSLLMLTIATFNASNCMTRTSPFCYSILHYNLLNISNILFNSFISFFYEFKLFVYKIIIMLLCLWYWILNK